MEDREEKAKAAEGRGGKRPSASYTFLICTDTHNILAMGLFSLTVTWLADRLNSGFGRNK